jgi:hypothetical protein
MIETNRRIRVMQCLEAAGMFDERMFIFWGYVGVARGV